MSSYEEASKTLDRITEELQRSTVPHPRPPPAIPSTVATATFPSPVPHRGSPSRYPDMSLHSYTSHSYSSPLTRTSPNKYQQMAMQDATFEQGVYVPPSMMEAAATTSFSDVDRAACSATSVISAFRELQSKAKAIEQERFIALRERDELRQRLSERRRSQAMWRSRSEIEATEGFLTVKAANEKLKYEYGDLDAKIAAQENIHQSIERGKTAQRAMIATLQDEIAHNKAKVYTLERQISLLNADLSSVESRSHQVEHVASRSPEQHLKQHKHLMRQVTSLEDDIDKVNRSKTKILSKVSSLHKYMDLIIKINAELCETLISREKAKAEVLRLSGKLVDVPPHYTWPKEIPYNSILEIVQQASKMTVDAAIRSTALKATREAARSITRALSPGKARSGAGSRGRSHSPSRHSFSGGRKDSSRNETSRSSSPNKGRYTAASEGGGGGGDDWIYHRPRHGTSPEAVSAGAASPYTTKLDRYINYLTELTHTDLDTSVLGGSTAAAGVRGRGDTGGGSSSPSKKLSFAVASTPNGASHHHGSLNGGEDRSGSAERRREAEARKRAVARQGAVTYATRFAAAANAAATTAAVHSTPTPVNSANCNHYMVHLQSDEDDSDDDSDDDNDLHNSSRRVASSGRRVTISGKSRRSSHASRKSSSSSSSTRSNTLRSQNSSWNRGSSSKGNRSFVRRGGSDGISHASASGTAPVTKRASFIPSGNNQASEFNIVASVSKASRAAKQLNATIASK